MKKIIRHKNLDGIIASGAFEEEDGDIGWEFIGYPGTDNEFRLIITFCKKNIKESFWVFVGKGFANGDGLVPPEVATLLAFKATNNEA